MSLCIKPYTDEKLKDAIDKTKLISLGEQAKRVDGAKKTESFLNRQTDLFPVRKASGDIVIINVNDCVYLKPDGKSVIIYLKEGYDEEAEFKPFAEWTEILEGRGFIRIHQKFLVNIRNIKKYVNRNKADITEEIQYSHKKGMSNNVKVMGDGGAVIMSNGDHVAVSRVYCHDLKDALNLS